MRAGNVVIPRFKSKPKLIPDGADGRGIKLVPVALIALDLLNVGLDAGPSELEAGKIERTIDFFYGGHGIGNQVFVADLDQLACRNSLADLLIALQK